MSTGSLGSKDSVKSTTVKKTPSMMGLRRMLSFSRSNDDVVEPVVDDKKPNVIPVESTAISIDDLKWVMEQSSSNEGQTFYLTLDNGIYMTTQAVYSTMGSNPITGTKVSIQLTAKIFFPDGKIITKSAALNGDVFQPSEDKLSLDCGPMTIQFDQSTRSYTVDFKTEDDATIHFKIQPESDYYKINDGKIFFKGEDEPGKGYVCTKFLPRAKVEGKMTVDGNDYDMAGLGVFTHAVQHQPLSVGKWNYLGFHSKDVSIVMYEFEMPPGTSYLRDIVSVTGIVKDKKLISVSTDNRVIHHQKVKDDFSGYNMPTEIRLLLNGTTLDSKKIECEHFQTLKEPLEKIDILAALPYALRVIIQTFVTSPFMFYYSVEGAKLKLKIGGATVETTGRILYETSFLSKKFR
ncbi:putative cell survival pathways protein [Phlyctochytrium planicorne]|nr:putative cell survival pathways protein [Phlyctochytrium planicorne]